MAIEGVSSSVNLAEICDRDYQLPNAGHAYPWPAQV